MTEELRRTYHGKEIVSRMNEEFIGGSDGWTHTVDGKEYATLGLALAAVRAKPKAKPKAKE